MPFPGVKFFAPLARAAAEIRQWYAGQRSRRPWLSYLLVFTASGLLSVYLHSTPTFADPDSFYHAKMAVLIRERGVFTAFPWLQFTVLKESYADHQFLYHLALIPFTSVMEPLVGVKLATILFFATAVTVFYAALRAWGVGGAWRYTAVLLVSSPFLFRANLAKAQPLAFALLFTFVATVVARRSRWAGALSFAYVWLYGGWPLLPLLAGLYLATRILWPEPAGGEVRFWPWPSVRPRLRQLAPDLRTFTAVVAGITGGLVLHPYFPHNLYFYWNQIVQIAVIGYRGVIGVGAEWYPYQPLELLAASSIATFLAVIGATIYALTLRRQGALATFLLLCTALFYVLTWRSRRNVEYLIPFELLFTAVAIKDGFAGLPLAAFRHEFAAFLREQKLFAAAAVLPLVAVPYIVVRDVTSARDAYAQGLPFTRFQAASAWLWTNAPPQAVVFQSDWDDFPLLFYHNSRSYYLVGLDATFMYRYDPERYRQWERVTTGRERARLYEVIAGSFGARYVFVGKEQDRTMGRLVSGNPNFREVYRDAEARIFEVLPAEEIPNPKH